MGALAQRGQELYLSDELYDGLRQKDDDAARRHAERVKRSLEKQKARKASKAGA